MEQRAEPGIWLGKELESLRQRISELQGLLVASSGGKTIRAEVAAKGSQKESKQRHGGIPSLPEILDEGPFGMAVVDTDFRLLKVNSALCRMLDYSEPELTALRLPDVIHAEDIGDCTDLVRQVLSGDMAYSHVEKRLVRNDKTILWARFTASMIKSQNKEPVCSLMIIEETSERRRLEEARHSPVKFLDELFDDATEMVYGHDLEGNLTFLNKAGERLTGYYRGEALQMSFLQLVAPSHIEAARRMIGQLRAGESVPVLEIEAVAKNGRHVPLEINSWPISREGKPVAIHGIARDITERRRTEGTIRQSELKPEAWVSQLEQQARDIALLGDMGDLLRLCTTIEEACPIIVRIAEQIFPAQVGALYVLVPFRNIFEAVAVWGNHSLAERTFSLDECWALRRRRAHWVEDTSKGVICKHLHYPAPNEYLCVPIMAQNEALGVLHLTPPESTRITDAKKRLASDMADHIALALSNYRLQESARGQSIRDSLTGLFTRGFMEESLELEMRHAFFNQHPLGIIMLDIDQFKPFSDTYGQEASDAVLREMGGLLQTFIRKEDLACRYSHDKFVVILPQGNFEVTQQRAECLRQMIKKLEVQHRGQVIGQVTASAGIAVFPDHGRTSETLLQAAEAALARSKRWRLHLTSSAG